MQRADFNVQRSECDVHGAECMSRTFHMYRVREAALISLAALLFLS